MAEVLVLPHFKPEEIEALQQEHVRREQAAKNRAVLDNDSERVRDGYQRLRFWDAQIENGDDSEHAKNEKADALFAVGEIARALQMTTNPERTAWYQKTYDAIMKDDSAKCNCDIETHVVGEYPSFKHNRMATIKVCPYCKEMNIA